MPFISQNRLARIRGSLHMRHHSYDKGSRMMATAVQTGEVVGGAMLMGFVRGKMEDKSSGAWNVPGTTNIDVELVAGVAGAAVAAFGLAGHYSKDVGNVANGVLAHYLGQVARKFAHTGQFSLIAGDEPKLLVGSSGYEAQSVLADALRQGV